MFDEKMLKTEEEIKPRCLLPLNESCESEFCLFSVGSTTFDPNPQGKREECTGRVNEKEGREE